jgi:hypothetical protein
MVVSRLMTVIILASMIFTGCSLMISLNGDEDNRLPAQITRPPVTPPSVDATAATAATDATNMPETVSTAAPVTVMPTAVFPLSGHHHDVPRSFSLAYFHVAPEPGAPIDRIASRASFVTLTRGDEKYRDTLRQAGYNGLVLQFLVASQVNGPGPYSNAGDACDFEFRPLRNGIVHERGEFCRDIHPNDDWFLHNGAGQRLHDFVGETGVWYHMNPASPGWRAYALHRILGDAVGPNALGYDGILLDGVELSMIKVAEQLANADGSVMEFQSDSAYRQAWIDYLETISDAIRGDVQLWANLLVDPNDGGSWTAYLHHLDGAMFLSFATGYRGVSVQRWENNLTQAEAALAMGKGFVAVGLGDTANENLQRFAAASYLLIAETERSYFRYVSRESRDELNSFWLYGNYDVTLGDPLGPRYRINDRWRRDFTCGFVEADPARVFAEIVQTECGSGT